MTWRMPWQPDGKCGTTLQCPYRNGDTMTINRFNYDTYMAGYRAGRIDRLLGIRLTVAVTSSYGYYAQGYRDGQFGFSESLAILLGRPF